MPNINRNYLFHSVRVCFGTTTGDEYRRRAESLLLRWPIYIAVALSVALMLSRFIVIALESLKAGTHDLTGFLLLAVLIGVVSVFIVANCAVIGMIFGWALKVLFAGKLAGALSRKMR